MRILFGPFGSMVECPPPTMILASLEQAEGSGFESQDGWLSQMSYTDTQGWIP